MSFSQQVALCSQFEQDDVIESHVMNVVRKLLCIESTGITAKAVFGGGLWTSQLLCWRKIY